MTFQELEKKLGIPLNPAGWHRHSNGGGWVQDTAKVDVTAFVGSEAVVYGKALVSGNAWVYGDAQVFGNAQVYDNAQVYGYAQVYGNAQVSGSHISQGHIWSANQPDQSVRLKELQEENSSLKAENIALKTLLID